MQSAGRYYFRLERVIVVVTGVTIMNIAVIGAGAIGSVIGGLLCKAGEDITLIGRKSHVNAINQNGLILGGQSGKTVISVKAEENLDYKPDLALLTVKAQDVVSSVSRVQVLLSGTQVVTMQNGVHSDDQVAEILGEENIISSVVVFNGQFLEPGEVSYSIPFSKTALLIGEPFGNKGNRLQSLSALLNKAISTDINEDIRAAHWTKLLWNLQTAVPAVTGLSYQESYQYPQIRTLVIKLIREGLKVNEMAGINIVDVPGFPIEPLKAMSKAPLSISSSMLEDKAKSLGKQPILGSTLQSIKRGKSTEVDYLNGEIVTLGKKVGIPTPVNSLIVELVHEVEASGKFLTVDALNHRLS
jgi:2-dehydropantoate 2-reductase